MLAGNTGFPFLPGDNICCHSFLILCHHSPTLCFTPLSTLLRMRCDTITKRIILPSVQLCLSYQWKTSICSPQKIAFVTFVSVALYTSQKQKGKGKQYFSNSCALNQQPSVSTWILICILSWKRQQNQLKEIQ